MGSTLFLGRVVLLFRLINSPKTSREVQRNIKKQKMTDAITKKKIKQIEQEVNNG